MKLNCLIIDDEPIARKGMAEYVNEIDFLHIVAQCENALKASTYLKEGTIDLLLLDIQMPKLSGIDFLKTIKEPPMAIFTTAYSEHALEGYSLNIIDYLVKPVPFQRFVQAVNKARDFYLMKHKTDQAAEKYFFVKSNGRYEKVDFSEVLFIESMQNYVVIHTRERKLITYLTLTGIETRLPNEQFLKVHKSFIVAFSKIESVDGNEITIKDTVIPISRMLKDEVMQKILGNNLFKR
jgi:DNA-binding LytR/AlgR family response regulator